MNDDLPLSHYNPGWLDDDTLVANFAARQQEFRFLRDSLARAPLAGSVQHYLLVGQRGAGKTTLLSRLAVAIRRDDDLKDHLLALSFPEELYQVKNLADFWWAACEALGDELERSGKADLARRLFDQVDRASARTPSSERDGLDLLLATCAELERRPVMLVDNLDFVIQRIEMGGRSKHKGTSSTTYWALREALSTTSSPIMIGGTVRLSEPFTSVDKAFYDFFLPQRLGKLPLKEVRDMLEQLARRQDDTQVLARLDERPARIQALYELTGGNPRAIGLVFKLLSRGPGSNAVGDFEGLMDLTTPYYKARFEDLADQAQVVMHALATRRSDRLGYGHTAAEIGMQAGLPTNTVSAQMELLVREGLVEKNADQGRTQYRIAEQLFRLWLQMRATRRIRQNALGLAAYLEALFDPDEMNTGLHDAKGRSGAMLAFAVAETTDDESLRHGLSAHGADLLLQHVNATGEAFEEYLSTGDLPKEVASSIDLRQRLGKCSGGGLDSAEQDALLGSLTVSQKEKEASVTALCSRESAASEVTRLRFVLEVERSQLLRESLLEVDLPLLFSLRAKGVLRMPNLSPADADTARITHRTPETVRMLWRLVGLRGIFRLADDAAALDWLAWAERHVADANSTEWANVAGSMRLSGRLGPARAALDRAFRLGESARAFHERASLARETGGDAAGAEADFRRAIDLAPGDPLPWNGLGSLLATDPIRLAEAEAAFRRAIDLDPDYVGPWRNLAELFREKPGRPEEAVQTSRKAMDLNPTDASTWTSIGISLARSPEGSGNAELAFRKAIELNPRLPSAWGNLGRFLSDRAETAEEARSALRHAIELDPKRVLLWINLGLLLAHRFGQMEEAEAAYRKATEVDPSFAPAWNNLGTSLQRTARSEAAEDAYRKAIELDSSYALAWSNLGNLLQRTARSEAAEDAYRKAIELDASNAPTWNNLGNLLHRTTRPEAAEEAYRKAIELDPNYAVAWNNLGNTLAQRPNRATESETAFNRAIQLNPRYALAWRNLGKLIGETSVRKKEAEAALLKAVEIDPGSGAFWNSLGTFLATRTEQTQEAEDAFRKAIEIDPRYAAPRNNLGVTLAKVKRFDEAMASFRKAIELDPAYAVPWIGVGNLLADSLNQPVEAESAYRKAIELDAQNATAWGRLGQLLARESRSSEARTMLETAVSLQPTSTLWKSRLSGAIARDIAQRGRAALDNDSAAGLRQVLAEIVNPGNDVPALLAASSFRDALLIPALADRRKAQMVLETMRDLDFDKHAKPLLLALEAAIEGQQQALDLLEPEVRGAAKRTYDLLMKGKLP